MNRIISSIFAALLLISCGGSDGESTNETVQDSLNTEVIESDIIIDINLSKQNSVPKECKIEGKMVDAYSWSDKNGLNYFIRSQGDLEAKYPTDDFEDVTSSQYIYAYHWVQSPTGEFKLLKETVDFVKNCEFDLIMGHELTAITLTDLDENGIAEISFIYRLTCTSDVSPSEQKLIMLEDGNKYPLRGYSEVMGEGGTYTAGEEFDTAPAAFLEHAKTLWSENVQEYDFDL